MRKLPGGITDARQSLARRSSRVSAHEAFITSSKSVSGYSLKCDAIGMQRSRCINTKRKTLGVDGQATEDARQCS